MNVTFESGGHSLCGVLDGAPPCPCVVMVHGWTSSKEAITYRTLGTELTAREISSLRFDLAGHGESDGSLETMTVTQGVADVLAALRVVRERGFAPVGLFGSSFGGMCAILAAAQTPVAAMVLKYPASVYEGIMFDGKKQRFIDDASRHDVYAAAKHIACAVLIVHGDADDRVPVTQSQRLAALLPCATLEEVPNAGHDFTDEQNRAAAQRAAAFFDEHLTRRQQ